MPFLDPNAQALPEGRPRQRPLQTSGGSIRFGRLWLSAGLALVAAFGLFGPRAAQPEAPPPPPVPVTTLALPLAPGETVGAALTMTRLDAAAERSTKADRARRAREARATRALRGGHASYYGDELAGRRTASGERFDPDELTAAHPSLPFGSRVRVTNVRNGRSIVVRINDRGPYSGARVIDVSHGAARRLGMLSRGTAMVRLELLRRH